jgi:signal transduction histidine kinase
MQHVLTRIWDIFGGASIRTKIFGLVLGSALLLSSSFAIQFQSAQKKELEDRIRGQGISVARDVAGRSTELVLKNDRFSLHELLAETELNYQDISYIFVVDNQGEILAHTFGSSFPGDLLSANSVDDHAFQNTQTLETEAGIIWDIAVPIFEGQAGVARVGISDTGMQETMGRLTTQISLTIGIILVISLLAATVLTWLLTRPILNLVSAAEAVSKGDYTQRVSRWANDEIGDLSIAFNNMTMELSRTDELRQEREILRMQLLEGVISAQEDERRRISLELHDGTSQSLTSLMVGLRNMDELCENPELHHHITDMRSIVGQTLEEVHNLALQLRPAALDDLGLEAALERFIADWENRNHIKVDMVVALGNERLPDPLETTIYRIIQEALTNICKHANAKSVSLLVKRRHGEVLTIIEDDGRGFDPLIARRNGRLGLVGIQERAELLGGHIAIETRPNQGTSIYAYLPVSAHHEINHEI